MAEWFILCILEKEWQASIFMNSGRVGGGETKEQRDGVAGLRVFASILGGALD